MIPERKTLLLDAVRPRPTTISPLSFETRSRARGLVFAFVASVEAIVSSTLFGAPGPTHPSADPIVFANTLAMVLLLALPAFVLIVWRSDESVLSDWRRAAARSSWAVPLTANLCLFVACMSARAVFVDHYGTDLGPILRWCYALMILAIGASLAIVAAPFSFWRTLVRGRPLELGLSVSAASFALGAGSIAKQGWEPLAAGTLWLAHKFLSSYESNAFVDPDKKLLGAGDFRVEIWPECSGYEGIALVLVFSAIFLWAFRRELRFPRALLLIPIGVALVWVLNAVRLALLVSIGAHVSRPMAIDGFHSYSGSIAFLLTMVGMMIVARNSPFFRVTEPTTETRSANDDFALAYLAPLMALLAASILASAFAPLHHGLYPVKVVAIGLALWWFRGQYASIAWRVAPSSIVIGLVIGGLWIVTEPERAAAAPIETWINEMPVAIAVIWLAMRVIGTSILVPIAEELAFRGFAYRALIDFRFAQDARIAFSLSALVISSLMFGVLHDRWIAASLAGAAYALLMWRNGRVSDAIAAHMATNAIIAAWALLAGNLALLG